jgi:hypothetical protein
MTQPVPPGAVSLSAATAIQLADGTWYTLAPGTLGAVISPSFTDPQTGQLISPGDTWFTWVDDVGQSYACPMRSIAAIKLAAPPQ